MLNMKKTFQVAALGLATIAPVAQAIILEGSFTGTITNSYDRTNEFGRGAGNNTVVGEVVTGTFFIDTDLMPSDQNSRTDIADHLENGNDDFFTFQMNTTFGHEWSSSHIDTNAGNQRDWDRVYVQNDYYYQSRDRILFQEHAYDNVGDQQYDHFWIQVISDSAGGYSGEDFLTDTVLPESFDMTDFDTGYARGHTRDYFYSNGQLVDDFYYTFDLTEFRWAPAEVPEPSSIALFGLGLIGLGFARRRVNALNEQQG